MANGNSSNPLQQYGYDSATGQQLAQSLGLTQQQLATAFSLTPMTGGSAPTTTSYGMTTGGQPQGRDLDATIQQLRLMQATGGNQNLSLQSGQGQVSQDPMNAAVNLGAAALNMPAVYNPTPGQIPAGAKGGVAQVASPTSSGTVPGVPAGPWNTTASVFGNQQQVQGMQNWAQHGGSGNPADAAAIEKQQGWAPGTIANQFAGTTTPNPGTTPNAQGQLPGTPTPTAIPNPRGAAPATPYATAPAAPGATAGAMPPVQAPAAPGPLDAAHQQALAHAGMSLYSHFGGDPSSASPQDILNFHGQLQNLIGGISGAGAPASSAGPDGTALASGGPPPTGAVQMPVKLAGGGMVPGRGNQDTVPALLTPGEYVIPKQQAAQIFGGRTPVRMADGGYVPETPEEARRKALTVPGSTGGNSPLQPSQTPANQQQGSQGSSAPSAPSSNQGYWSNLVNQVQNRAGGGTPAGGWPSQTPSVAPSYDQPSDPDPDWQYTGAESAAGPTGAGGGSANALAGGADIASGLVSGLQKAAQTYADSIKNWQMQPQAFGKQGTPNYQNTTFQQDQTA